MNDDTMDALRNALRQTLEEQGVTVDEAPVLAEKLSALGDEDLQAFAGGVIGAQRAYIFDSGSQAAITLAVIAGFLIGVCVKDGVAAWLTVNGIQSKAFERPSICKFLAQQAIIFQPDAPVVEFGGVVVHIGGTQ